MKAMMVGMIVTGWLCLRARELPAEETPSFQQEMIQGRVEYRAGKWKQAAEHFLNAAQRSEGLSPSDLAAWTLLARALSKDGQTSSAIESLRLLEKRYAQWDAVDPATSGSLRDHALMQAAYYRATILESAGQYNEAVASHMAAKDIGLRLRDQDKTTTASERSYLKLGDENHCDLLIAECYMNSHDTTAALSVYRRIAERYRREGTLALLRSQRGPEALLDKYYVNVYLKKKIGDCLHDRASYREALAAHCAFEPRERATVERLAGKRWITRIELERLAAEKAADKPPQKNLWVNLGSGRSPSV